MPTIPHSARTPDESLPNRLDELAPHSQSALLTARAITRGIEVSLISRGRLELRYGERRHRFRSGWSTLNGPLVRRCMAQKEVTSRLLRQQGIPAPENTLFQGDDTDRAWRWAEPILPVVVKPNDASKGTLVHVGVRSYEDFVKAFTAVADTYGQVLVEKQVAGTEHRFAVVADQVIAVTERVPPHVLGDGTSSVTDLVARKNHERLTRNLPLHREPLTIDDDIIHTLRSQELTLDSVPPPAARVWLRRTSNISLGGEAVDRTDSVRREAVALVEQASRAIPGLRLAGIDVLLPESGSGPPTIIEINPNPMLSMHVFPWQGQPREVYERVLDAMFPETGS